MAIYFVTLNGEQIPGDYWPFKEDARDALMAEAKTTLRRLSLLYPNEHYRMEHDENWDWADLIHCKDNSYGELFRETKSHVFSVKEGNFSDIKKL